MRRVLTLYVLRFRLGLITLSDVHGLPEAVGGIVKVRDPSRMARVGVGCWVTARRSRGRGGSTGRWPSGTTGYRR